MAGGGEVPEVESGMDGADGIAGAPGEAGADGLEGLPGLGGGGGGTNAITDKATTKSLGKRGKDIGNLLALPFRDRTTEADPRSKFASLSEHLPPVMVEKMEKTLTTIKEQTEYEDPTASTIIIRVPTSAPQLSLIHI